MVARVIAVASLALVYFVVLGRGDVGAACPGSAGAASAGPNRGGPVRAPVAVPRVLVAEVTDARTRRAHLVTEAAFSAGCRAGRYAAMCGAEVLAASLTTLDLGYCRACLAQWRADR